jgi:GlpG protein
MRMIGTIPLADDAERFSDYLLTQKIDNLVEESSTGEANGNWLVWIEHDDDIDRGKSELATFLQNPSDPKYHAAGQAEKIRKQEEKSQQRRRKQFIDVRTSWGAPQQWKVPVTLALMILTLVISIGTNSIGFFGENHPAALDWFGYVSLNEQRIEQFWTTTTPGESESHAMVGYWLDTLAHGEVWRLFTPMFLHWSFLHLLFNLFWLRDLGALIETRRGTWRFLGLIVLCALLSGLAQFFWKLPHLPNFGGMSGVNYGLFGYIWVKGRYERYLGLQISDQSSYILIAWLFLCMTGWMGPVANAGHVGGLLTGAAVAYLPIFLRRVRRVR